MTGEQKPGGLEVVGYLVRWEAKESPTYRCRIQLSDVVEPWVHECGPSFTPLTPAEPAEARIRELEAAYRAAESDAMDLRKRATAAEAKLARAVGETLDAAADYLAKQYGNSFGLDHQTDRARIVAALQQEGE